MRRILATILLGLLIAPAANSSTKSINLKEAINKVVLIHEDIRISEYEQKRAEWQVEEARSGYHPQISISARNIYYHKIPNLNLPGVSVPAKMDWERTLQIQLSQALWTFGALNSGSNIANEALDLAKDRKTLIKNVVTLHTKQAYYSALFHQESLTLYEESIKNAKRNKRILQSRYNNNVPRHSKIKIERDIASRIPSLLDSEQKYEETLNSLKSLLKEKLSIDLKLSDSLVIPADLKYKDLETLYQEVLKKNPQYKMLKRSITINTEKVSLEKAKRFPVIAAFTTYNNDLNKDDFDDTMKGGDETLAIGLAVTADLWDGRAGRSRQYAAKEGVEIAKEEKIKWEREIKATLANLLSNFKQTKATYESQKRLEKLAKETYRLTSNLFKTGQATLTDLNDAELNLTAARLQSLGSMLSLNMLQANLDNLTSN